MYLTYYFWLVAHGLKDQTVNPQVANVEHKNLQVLDMHHNNAISKSYDYFKCRKGHLRAIFRVSAARGFKDQTINPQIKAGHEKNAQVLDMHHNNAVSKFSCR